MENTNLEQRVSSLEKRIEEIENKLSNSGIKQNADQLLPTKKLSIKEFLITKKTDNGVQLTIAIAYFLEKFEGMGSFNIDDLKKCYQLAKQPLPSNPNDKVNMGIRSGYIMESAEKKDAKKAWTLTATGENFVENELNKTNV